MASTPSPLAQPTGLHCSGAGGWLSPSDPVQLLALITALCPHTVQMGPFVGLSWSLGAMGRGGWGNLVGGCHEDLLCHLKKGENSKHRAQKQALLRKAKREPFLYTALFIWLCGWNILSSKTQNTCLSCIGDDTQEREK